MIGIDPTPFDVRLVAFRIPIRVHPSFWLLGILLGSNLESNQLIFLNVICLFISVLVHELGHAFTAEAFDWPTEIVLYFGGGLAISQRYRNNTPWRSILVSLMGPVAGFLLLGLVIGVEQWFDAIHFAENEYRSAVFDFLKFMNLYYGLFNLLPALPLDGGRIVESLCQAMHFRNPLGIALRIGAVTSGVAAYFLFVKAKQPLAGAMMLMLCLQSVGALQSRR